MKHGLATAVFFCAALCAPNVYAVDFSFDGYGDLRFVAPSAEISYLDGGLGKLRYGSEDGRPNLYLSELAFQARAQITTGVSSVVVVRSDPNDGLVGDILEGYGR